MGLIYGVKVTKINKNRILPNKITKYGKIP